jgi:hypothetical protein
MKALRSRAIKDFAVHKYADLLSMATNFPPHDDAHGPYIMRKPRRLAEDQSGSSATKD